MSKSVSDPKRRASVKEMAYSTTVELGPEFAAMIAAIPRGTTAALGRRLMAFRDQRELTQGDLAKLLGKSRTTINQYETGKIEPPLKMVSQLAETLEVDPALLAFGEPRSDPSLASRISLFQSDDPQSEYIELSEGIRARLGLAEPGGQLIELPSDAPHFSLRRGDLVVVDTSQTTICGDGRLYIARAPAGGLSVIRSEIQLEEESERIRLTFGQGQVSEVDSAKVEILGVVKATLRAE